MVEEGVILESKNDKKWKIVRPVRSGKCCDVYEGLGLHDHSQVAIKIYNEGNQFTCAHQREYLLLKIVTDKHGPVPQLVSLIDDCCYGNQQVLVEEYLSPSLPEILYMVKQDGGHISTYLIYKILTDIARGFSILHESGFIHADLKPDNILWSPQAGCFKLIDFGLAFHKQDKEVGLVQCTSYRAPEVCSPDYSSILPSTPIDIWSLGVLVLYLVTGEKITDYQNHSGVCQACQVPEGGLTCKNREIIGPLFAEISGLEETRLDLLLDITIRCLQCRPESRPSAVEICQLLSTIQSCNATYLDLLILPSNILRFTNMVDEVDLIDPVEIQDIKEDILEECSKHGQVTECFIPLTGQAIGKVYICYSTPKEAMTAFSRLKGRTFNERTVITTYFPLHHYHYNNFY